MESQERWAKVEDFHRVVQEVWEDEIGPILKLHKINYHHFGQLRSFLIYALVFYPKLQNFNFGFEFLYRFDSCGQEKTNG
jgi:hypothetical protein